MSLGDNYALPEKVGQGLGYILTASVSVWHTIQPRIFFKSPSKSCFFSLISLIFQTNYLAMHLSHNNATTTIWVSFCNGTKEA